MRKIILTGIVLITLILDWAALDDITTGNEPDFFGEYLILIISIPVIIFAVYLFLKKKK